MIPLTPLNDLAHAIRSRTNCEGKMTANLKLVTDNMTLEGMDHLEELQSIFADDTSHRVVIGKRLLALQARRGKAGWPAWLKANMPAGRSYSFYSGCMTEALSGKSRQQRENVARATSFPGQEMNTEVEEIPFSITTCTLDSMLEHAKTQWWGQCSKEEWLNAASRAYDAGYFRLCNTAGKEYKPRSKKP